jgi:hypothetical protein
MCGHRKQEESSLLVALVPECAKLSHALHVKLQQWGGAGMMGRTATVDVSHSSFAPFTVKDLTSRFTETPSCYVSIQVH